MLTMCLALVPMLFAANENAVVNQPREVTVDGSSGHRGVPVVVREGMNLGRQTVIDSIPAPGVSHMGLGWDGTYLYSASNDLGPPTRLVYVIDPVTGTVVNTITTTLTGYVLGATYLNGSLWLQQFSPDNTTYEIDPNTGNILSSFLSPAANPRGLTNDGTDLWIMDASNQIAYLITTTGTVVRSVSMPMVEWAMDAAWNSQRGTLFLCDDGLANNIKELDVSGSLAILLDEFPHPGAIYTPEGITYDGQYLWTTAFDALWIWQIDIGDPGPQPGILYVDDDDDAVLSGYFETSFSNLGIAYDIWVVTDSGDVTPDASVMGTYDIVVWTTGDDWSSTFVGNDTIEVANYFAGGGKMWLSSEDILYDLGPVSWLHVASYTSDIGCDAATGVGPIMTGTSFATTGGVVFDYSDEINPDAFAWTEMQNETPVDNTIAMDPSTGLSYYLFFNAFAFENINAEADRDTMMQRVLTWLAQPAPYHDVGTISYDSPAIVPENTTYSPLATVYNFGNSTETFDVTCEINPGAYTSTQTVTALDPSISAQVTFDPFTFVAGLYNVTVYTQLAGDGNTANDTLYTTVEASNWLYYDDGIPSSAWAWYDADNGWGVQFPAPGDLWVDSIAVHIWESAWPSPGGTDATFRIYDGATEPTNIRQELTGVTVVRDAWNKFALDTTLTHFAAGENIYPFYIQVLAYPNCPGLTIDAAVSEPGYMWQVLAGVFSVENSGGDWLMRIHVITETGISEWISPVTPDALMFSAPTITKAETRIEFTLPEATKTDLLVYDATGRLCTTLLSNRLCAGTHSISANLNLAAGIYFYNLKTESGINITRKFLLVK